MRKFYSLVLLAVGLLIGTNAWAGVHDKQFDNDVASVKKGSETKYAATLQEAIDYIGAGETGTVTLINEDETVVSLTVPVMIPHITEANPTAQNQVVNRELQHITLDLNDHTIQCPDACIALAKGDLFITGGTIEKTGTSTGNWKRSAIVVSGAAGDKNATEESHANDHSKEWWSILTIDENVLVTSQKTNTFGIGIINIGTTTYGQNGNRPYDDGGLWTDAQLGYFTYNNWKKGTTGTYDPMWFRSHMNDNTETREQGSAFGVKVTVKGEVFGPRRGIHIVGHVNQKPFGFKEIKSGYHVENEKRQPITETNPFYYKHYFPWLIIASTAKVHCQAENYNSDEVAGIYAAGWAVIDVQGKVYGQNGIFAKGGDIVLDGDANVYSNASSFGADGFANGEVSGNGIFMTTDYGYPGEMSLDIKGTSTVSGGGGAAIIDVVANATTTPDVDHITITGGTIEGGSQGAILLTEGSADKTVAYGGTNITGAIQKDGQDIEVSNITADGTHVTNVTDPETGKTTIVVSSGEDPTAKATWAEVAAIENRGNANWTGLVGAISDGERVELGELQMKAGDENNLQVLTINDGGALVVNHLVMNAYARIIVEAGGLLVVDGTEGVYSNNVENILLKTTATKHATFLYHPNVATNSHPKATVEFATYSFCNAAKSNYQYQRFGIPTWNALESFNCDQYGIVSKIYAYENGAGWQLLGELTGGTPFANVSSMNKPFTMYNLLAYNNSETAYNTYTMTGSLVGNANASYNANLEWNTIANSYTADINGAALVASLNGYSNVEHTVYFANHSGNGSYTFDAVDETWVATEKVAPMNTFMLHNAGTDRDIIALNYNNLVWTPATSNLAPRRNRANENTAKLRIVVSNEQGTCDNVKMTESTSNDHNAVKYMNDDVNIFVQAEEKYAIIANDNLEDTYFGFSTVKGGEFTISFTNVEGREFDLIDLETGAKVAVMEGETYSFAAAANTVADYRFKLVERAKMPTAIENTEAVKTVKGIYTLTGQYLGEMNVWNTLPAGVYVVNGEKRVK